MHVVYERCAAIDVGKDEIAVAVRMPGDGPDGPVTVKRTFRTFYGVMGEAARWLVSLGVTHVAMEATGITACRCITPWWSTGTSSGC
jgi:transposase